MSRCVVLTTRCVDLAASRVILTTRCIVLSYFWRPASRGRRVLWGSRRRDTRRTAGAAAGLSQRRSTSVLKSRNPELKLVTRRDRSARSLAERNLHFRHQLRCQLTGLNPTDLTIDGGDQHLIISGYHYCQKWWLG